MFDITAIINHPLTLVVALVGGIAINTLVATHQTDKAILYRLDAIETQLAENGRRLDALTVQVQENGERIAVLTERITRLHPETALRFHGDTDHFNAGQP